MNTAKLEGRNLGDYFLEYVHDSLLRDLRNQSKNLVSNFGKNDIGDTKHVVFPMEKEGFNDLESSVERIWEDAKFANFEGGTVQDFAKVV